MTLADKTKLKILAGSALTGSALVALLASLKKTDKDKNETDSHNIYVPLSYKSLTRPLREKHESKKKAPREAVPLLPAPEEVSAALAASGADSLEGLSDKDMASLKKRLLKGASDCSKECAKECAKECKPDTDVAHNNSLKEEAEIADHAEVKHVNAPVFEEAVIGHTDGQPRDAAGRFVAKPFSEKQEKQAKQATQEKPAETEKKAFTLVGEPLDDATRVVKYFGLGTAGVLGGAYITKKIFDKIQLKREQNRLEEARRMYADAVNKEMNDVDLPYYTSKHSDGEKRASDNKETGILGQGLGVYVAAGLISSAVAGALAYKIMDNRREHEDRQLYKNLGSSTPTVMYKVVKDKNSVPVK